MNERRGCQVECLISLPACGGVVIVRAVIRLPPHLLPIRGGISYFKCNKESCLPREAQVDTRVQIKSVPEHIAEPASEN